MTQIGSHVFRIDQTLVEVRLFTEVEGLRQIQRMKESFQLIPVHAFAILANQMVNSYANFTENNLKESDANLSFEANSGRQIKFTFRKGCQIVVFVKMRIFRNRNSHFHNYRNPIYNPAFRQSEMKTSSEFPQTILILIEIGQRV